MRRLPPVRALQVFETAAGFDSFTRAAEALCVTHGAVSHQIRSLEAWLDEELFIRHSDGIGLTDAGIALQAVCSEAFGSLEAVCRRIRDRELGGRLRVGCSGSFIGSWLIPCVEHFEKNNPEVKLELCVADDLTALLARRVDAVITVGPQPRFKEIAATFLAHDVIGPVCSKSLATRICRGDDLRGPFLHTKSRPQAWLDWSRIADTRVAAEENRHFDTLTMTLEAARCGLGFAIAPELLVRRELETGALQAPFGFHDTGAAIYFCTRADATDSQPVHCLLNWLSKEIGPQK